MRDDCSYVKLCKRKREGRRADHGVDQRVPRRRRTRLTQPRAREVLSGLLRLRARVEVGGEKLIRQSPHRSRRSPRAKARIGRLRG